MKTAYPNTNQPVKITLYCNVPFDNSYKNHPMISSLFTYNGSNIFSGTSNARELFLNIKSKESGVPRPRMPRFILEGEYNFNYSNALLSSLTLELTTQQTNANYMKVVCGTDIYYYFITSITQNNFDTYTLSLELDVLMTYQDEFLEGIKDIPVMTKRKHSHRYTDDGLMPCGADLKTGDSAFAGIKPSLIKQVHQFHYDDDEMKKLEGVMWLYVCCDDISVSEYEIDNEYLIYKNNDKAYPLSMMCVPVNVNSLTYANTNNSHSKTWTRNDIINGIKKLIGEGKVHGAKISPYPPFTSVGSGSVIYNNGDLTIKSSVSVVRTFANLFELCEMTLYGNYIVYARALTTQLDGNAPIYMMLNNGFSVVSYQNRSNYEYENISNDDLGLTNSVRPSINDIRYKNPKLLFNPFRKYILSAQYSGEGCEIHCELLFSENETTSDGYYFWFETISTGYIGDNNFYTSILSSTDTYDYYKYEKIGLSSGVNYIFPCGTNALEVFNATQAQSFYTSKVASGITSGLAVAGGIGSIALGSIAVSHPATALMGGGMLVGGITGVAGGVSGIVNSVKSTEAKKEDLKNTPNSINISGSNFITDDNIVGDMNGLPYLVVYECSKTTQQTADDYFYHYGYEVSRECYFNTDLYFENNPSVNPTDNNLFGRTLFNYIELSEDITDKINANIPLVIKQKISKIFMSGITLWSFFGFDGLWNDNITYPNVNQWFMKSEYDNTEYYQ